MKHNFKFYAAIACSAIALASCSSDAVEDVKTAGKQQMVFTAQQETSVGSRTSLGSDLSVLWSTGDALSVLDGTSNNNFTLTSGNGTASAEFAGTAMAVSTYYALYPYQSAASLSGNVISNVEIPTVQKATEGTFDPKAAIMTAVSDQSNNFQFKNVSSSARIITTAACKKITFTAGATDKIAGKFNMTVGADGIITASTATDATNAVTLVPSSGETFAAGTYYISINPGTISSLKVECEYTDKTLYQSVAYSISKFQRGSIIDLGIASIEEGYKERIPGILKTGFWVSPTQKVRFASGNLQYVGYVPEGETPYWRIAPSQFSCFGDENGTATSYNTSGAKIKENTNLDLFGWGDIGQYNDGRWSFLGSLVPSDYSGLFKDWGSIASTTTLWADKKKGIECPVKDFRTLSLDEWRYLLNEERSHQKCACVHVSDMENEACKGNGLVVFPREVESVPGINVPNTIYTNNTITSKVIEDYGLLFLPAAGVRRGYNQQFGEVGGYWSSTADWLIDFASGLIHPGENLGKYYGLSVRLAQNISQ